jgi:DNA modification methylase
LKKKGQKPVFDRSKISKDYISEVWNITAKRNKQHPAPFPYELVLNCVLPFTNNNETITVLDPFMGCGTTGMVCKDLGINFIGVEIDEMYYNIALENTQ